MGTKDDKLCVGVYEGMNLGAKKKDMSAAKEWLKQHKRLDCWIDGKYSAPKDEITYSEIIFGEDKCLVAESRKFSVHTAWDSSTKAQAKWILTSHITRLTILDKIVRGLRSKKKLLTNLYDLQCQKNDFDLFLDIFNFYSGLSYPEENNLKANCVVLLVLFDTTPVWFLAMVSAAALWAGCSIIIKPSTKTPLFPFVLAEICSEFGLPNGVINVVPGSSEITNELFTLKFGKVILGGSYSEQSQIGLMAAVNDFSQFIFGHTSFIIFESCDVDGAVDKLFSENWGCSQQSPWNADLILVQESIFQIFIQKLTSKMKTFDVNNQSFGFKEKMTLNLQKTLAEIQEIGVKIYMTKDDSGPDQILITEYDLGIDEPGVPIATLLAFKTAKEAVDIVNNASYCIGTSIWTDNLAQAMEVSSQLETCTTWVNCHGVMDASVPVEVLRKSGVGVLGGYDGGLSFMIHGMEYSEQAGESLLPVADSKELDEVIKKSKSSFTKWKFNKNRKEHLIDIFHEIRGTVECGRPNFILSNTLEFWALNGNSYTITMSTPKESVYAAQSKKPIGVIAMILNDNQENSEIFVSWVSPAIVMGNVVIVVVPEDVYPALEPVIKCFVEKLPNGVVNVVKGINKARGLAKDSRVQAVWLKRPDSSIQRDIRSCGISKRLWLPPYPVPVCKTLLGKHCLKNQTIWFPTINCSS